MSVHGRLKAPAELGFACASVRRVKNCVQVCSMLYFAIGFFATAFSVVVFTPPIHDHLVRLTTRQPQDALDGKPISWR